MLCHKLGYKDSWDSAPNEVLWMPKNHDAGSHYYSRAAGTTSSPQTGWLRIWWKDLWKVSPSRQWTLLGKLVFQQLQSWPVGYEKPQLTKQPTRLIYRRSMLDGMPKSASLLEQQNSCTVSCRICSAWNDVVKSPWWTSLLKILSNKSLSAGLRQSIF